MRPTSFYDRPSHSMYLPNTGLFAGQHRITNHLTPIIQPLLEEKTELENFKINHFFQKVDSMEEDLKHIINTFKDNSIPTLHAKNQELEILNIKLDKIKRNTFKAPQHQSQQLTFIYNILKKLNPDDELVMKPNQQIEISKRRWSQINLHNSSLEAFLSIISLFSESFHQGVFIFDNRETTLIDVMIALGKTTWGENLIFSDQKYYFVYCDAFVLFLSKYLGLIHPRNIVLEEQFSVLNEIMQNLQNKINQVTSIKETGKGFLMVLHEFTEEVLTEFSRSYKSLRTELSQKTKPIPADMTIPELKYDPYFSNRQIVDNNEIESELKIIQKILEELTTTEKSFLEKLTIICKNETIFELLHKEGLIETDTYTKNWRKLYESSKTFAQQFDTNPDIIEQQLQACLIAFSPQNFNSYMENFSNLIYQYAETDKTIKQIQKIEKGNRLIENYSKTNKIDLFDTLIRPVQRPMRYILLLKELIKHFPQGNVRTALEERLQFILKWIESINLLNNYS